MSSERETKEKEVMDSLRVISQYIQRYSKSLEKEFTLSASQLMAMWTIKESEKLRISDIAKALSIHLSTASNMLDKIENKKLIKRVREGKDMRAVYIRLTKKGENLLSKAPHPSQGNLAKALRATGDKQINSLNRNLGKLICSLEQS
ncbi:MAG: MarR family winged helix-turn-helix transcriptional regulator [Gammaproteobacteria bacterium]|nr:MarR family winged helix-turn-helix transcriptional regulator [Gammaproteobacteria bacterium]NNC67374.1 winged helix-turn-helix transcriptional regulator [Gammaproteobacteria bacterium]